MARWHYDLCGAEPIIRDVPIYSSSAIYNGEMVMANTIGSSTTGAGFISIGGGGSSVLDTLGVCLETITTTSKADYGDDITTAATTSTAAISSIASTVALGSRYGKVIINPFAVYLLDYDMSSASYFTCAANAGTTTYTDTVERYAEGSWFYVVPGSTAANVGQLGYVTATSTTASWTLLAAMTTTTSDNGINIKRVNHRLVGVNAAGAATKLSNLTTNDAQGTATFHVMENYVSGKNRPMEVLRAQVHSGLQDSTLKFSSDIVQLDHVYNVLS
jgi:hypothetical protein